MKNKRRNRVFLLLFCVLTVGLSGNIVIAEEIKDSESNSSIAEVQQEPDLAQDDADEETGKEVYASGLHSENQLMDSIITSMDENGNIVEVEDVAGMLDGDMSLYMRSAEPRIVNFNIKGNSVTEYQEYGTGYSGYTNGMYGADAAYLGVENGKIKFMLSGVIGLVDSNAVQVVNLNNASSISYYAVSGGRLIHNITTNITKDSYPSTLDNGPAPSYLSEGERYYSYDGHFFYKREAFGSMVNDYNSGTRNNAINSSSPYYNYYQYLPLRSKTTYSASQLNSIIKDNAASSTSKMLNTGDTFLSYQNKYGVNAILSVGIAANESWWGKSSIALNKNNLFGLNAVDSAPEGNADLYSSIDNCIKTFSETYMSKQYLNPGNWVYAGGYLGNKASGMNVNYASDPYWGEKNANIAWLIDKRSGNKDIYSYTIGIKDVIGVEHNNFNLRTEPNMESAIPYTTKKYSNQAFLILDKQPVNGFYKIQSDAALDMNRTRISANGDYQFDNMYLYLSAGSISIVSNGNGQNDNIDSVPVPKELSEAISIETHVQEIGWQNLKKNGQVAGTIGQNLPVEAVKIHTSGINGLGIKYSSHIQDIGWQDFVFDGKESGTVGQAKKMEAIRIELTGENAEQYDLYYRAHVSEIGWLHWAKNGELSGTQGYGYALQALQVVLLPKGSTAPGQTLTPFKINTMKLNYCAHVQDVGWQENVCNGELAGTVGNNKKIEAFKIESGNSEIKYRAYIQDRGWQEYTENGKVAGTTGENRRIEAIQIEFIGRTKEQYDIYYRVHVQDIGWLGWASNGEEAGTLNYDLKIEALQIVVMPKGTPPIGSQENSYLKKPTSIIYSAHVEDIGWQDYVSNGAVAGTTGKNKQVEALKVKLKGPEYDGEIQYSAHVEDIGWQDYVSGGEISGTVGKNKQIEAIRLKLTDKIAEEYNVYYRVHSSDFGWLGWAKNGEPAGSEGYARQVEALEIKLVVKGGQAPEETGNAFWDKGAEIKYSAHVSDIGWQNYVSSGDTAGTVGMNKQMEALKIMLPEKKYNGDIEYSVHVSDIGWQDYVKNNKIAGTVGKNKQLEAVKIKLKGDVSKKYNVYYRVHSSDYGWLDWTKNGEPAGTEGCGKKAEAIQIKLVEKNSSPPGNTTLPFVKK